MKELQFMKNLEKRGIEYYTIYSKKHWNYIIYIPDIHGGFHTVYIGLELIFIQHEDSRPEKYCIYENQGRAISVVELRKLIS